jgi:putative secretion ATPase (PEP-CTERM system associated)
MYESFYHLREKPFHLSPNPRFFFGSSGHKRVLAYLRYGVHQGEGFIIVTGEVGAGKTTLVYTLLEELGDQKDIVVAHLCTSQPDMDDLLPTIAINFGVHQEGLSKASLQHRLEQFLDHQCREGKRVLLIVDEAQNLSLQALEGLRLLTNYQTNRKMPLQGFLLGQAEFRDKLSSPPLEQLRQRVVASYHLGPMNTDETRQYIGHRLSIAGWSGDPSFTPQTYDAIYDYTGGIPRRINTLCDRLLLVGFLEETHQIDGALANTVIQELNEESFSSGPNSEQTQTIVLSEQPKDNNPFNPISFTPAIQNPYKEKRLTNIEERVAAVEEAIARIQDLPIFIPGGDAEFLVENSDNLENDSGKQRLTDIEKRLATLEEDLVPTPDSPEPFLDTLDSPDPDQPPFSQTAASPRSGPTVIRRLSFVFVLALLTGLGWVAYQYSLMPDLGARLTSLWAPQDNVPSAPPTTTASPKPTPDQSLSGGISSKPPTPNVSLLESLPTSDSTDVDQQSPLNQWTSANQDSTKAVPNLSKAVSLSDSDEISPLKNQAVADDDLDSAQNTTADLDDLQRRVINGGASTQADRAIEEPESLTLNNTPAQADRAIEEDTAMAITATDNSQLTLEFSADCWVEVKDADGQRLAYGAMKANTAKTVSGAAPFSVMLGNAPAVRIILDGQIVDKQTYLPETGSVSRIVLERPEAIQSAR